MKPSSYLTLETEVLLKNGLGTRYGLGVAVSSESGHRALWHSGGVSGYTAENIVFPDERLAVVVLTNQDGADAEAIARGIARLLLASDDPAAAVKLAQARKIFEGLQHGTIDRSHFTDNANFYFNQEALKDYGSSLGPLGMPEEFVQLRQELLGGMTGRVYTIKFPNAKLSARTYEMPDGKFEQYQIMVQY